MVYEFSKIHSFPPLYTKQPNLTIFASQLESWCEIILSYCEFYKIQTLSSKGVPIHSQDPSLIISDLPPIFENKLLERRANDELRQAIFKHLIHKLRRGDYVDPKQPELGVIVYWISLEEWANMLYSYIDTSGQLGTIITIYELTSLEDSNVPIQLKNMDTNLLIKVLKDVLVGQGKAQLLKGEDDEIGGVKIV